MKKGEIGNGTVGTTLYPDRGFIETPDGKVSLKHVIPGQTIEYRIIKKRKGTGEGKILKVLSKSPLETETDSCPHADRCGGCLYQTVPYEEQLRIKEAQVKKLLADFSDECSWEELIGSPLEKAYRAKMEYTFGNEYKDGPISLGLHRRDSRFDIIPVPECRIAHADFGKILSETLHYFETQNVSFYHKMDHEGILRHLVIRRGQKTGEILTDLITASGLEKEILSGWKDRVLSLKTEGEICGILHTVNDSLSDAVIDQGTEILYGRDCFYEDILGLRFKITPFSFFQNNSGAAELLYLKVKEYAGDIGGMTIFDLYCGTGTISQVLSRYAKQTVGVEIVSEAVKAAEENAERNGIRNCTFREGDVQAVLEDTSVKPDMIVLDPPREGVHPKALSLIASYGVERIVYISCKATSMLNDLTVLTDYGYRVKKICCVDMFPQTPNVETVCLLTRINS
jgi:23S rRNA (uracil1939-C5)-methyltransferase